MRHLVKTNFEPLFKNFFDLETPAFGNSEFMPPVNIAENEHEYHLEFFLAGYKKEDLKVKLENDHLTVSAQSSTEKTEENEKKHYTRREYISKAFSRSFYIPEQIKEKDIQAQYENGILTLVLPKAVKQQAKEISIK